MQGLAGMREPQVAGLFYPAEKLACLMALETATEAAPRIHCQRPKVVVAPHAGWSYCLDVIASAFTPLREHAASIRRVVLVGPAHKASFEGIATPQAAAWQTPVGMIDTADPTLKLLTIGGKVQCRDDYFVHEHALEVLAPMIRHMLPQARLVPLLVGDATDEQLIDVLRALWGGPETIIVISSDLTHFLTQDMARSIDDKTRQAIETLKSDALSAQEACGFRALRAVLALARQHDLRFTGIDLRTSADSVGNPERVVGYGAFIGEYAQHAALSEANRALMISVARDVLKSAVKNNGRMPSLTLNGNLPPELTAWRASFVTLTLHGQLRGCIGSLQPNRSLLDDVAQNVVKAAFSDPRFKPLSEAELDHVALDISIMSHPRPLHYSCEVDLIRQLRPDVDGLILADGGKSGLFLPSVWQTLPLAAEFWLGLKRKAGLPEDHFTDTMTVRRFVVETFGASSKVVANKIINSQAA